MSLLLLFRPRSPSGGPGLPDVIVATVRQVHLRKATARVQTRRVAGRNPRRADEQLARGVRSLVPLRKARKL
jgi:hypothetical protein